MAKEVFIPKLGQTMEEATLIRWLLADGAQVEQGQEILEVETDKAIFTVEATARGTLHIGPYQPGDVVPVLTVVAMIGKSEDRFAPGTGQVIPEPTATPVAQEALARPAPPAGGLRQPNDVGTVFASPRARLLAQTSGVDLAQVTPTGYGGERVAERDVRAYLSQSPRATPVAQRAAVDAGLDLRNVIGSGTGGQITKDDVMRAIAPGSPPNAAPGAEVEILERVPLKGVRAIIADRMATSVHTTARVTLNMQVDATEFVNMRERLKLRLEQEWGFAPGYNDLLAQFVVAALSRFPYMNARLTADAIERLAHVNLGMAVDTERGLLVPVVRRADKKSLREFCQEFRELLERARTGRMLPDDLTGGTFTITNLGMYDVMDFTPIINLPEAAILGVGNIKPQPVARDDQVVIRKIMHLSLAFDHRLVDGAPAARFLQHVKDLIEEPYLLVTA
jgi:pyruvate dehydrogenase E2 component (dihydrolipoamide acetyltransferase)